MKKYLIFSLLCVISVQLMAQKISGIVKDDAGKPVGGATVFLLAAKDSSTIKFAATKADGQYVFNGIEAGTFLVKTTHVGFKNKFSAPVNVGDADVTVAELLMAKNSTNLSAVVVTSQKPMVEIKADKTILNVEGTINAVGSDVLELLRKSPGVMVDKDDNLSLSARTG